MKSLLLFVSLFLPLCLFGQAVSRPELKRTNDLIDIRMQDLDTILYNLLHGEWVDGDTANILLATNFTKSFVRNDATNHQQSFSIDFAGMGNGVPGAAGFVDYRSRNWNILGVLSNDTRITNGYLEADMSLPSGRTAAYLYPSNGIPFPVTEIGIEYEHVWTNANTGFLAAMNMSLSTNPMVVAGEINWSVGFHITIAYQTITVDLLTNGLGSSVNLGTFNVDNGFQISNFGQRKHLRLIFPGNNTIQCVGDGFWGSITNSRIEQFRATGTNKTYAYWEWGNFSGSSVPFYTFRTYSVWANNQLEYEGGTPLPLDYGRNANNYLSRSNTTVNLGIISPTVDAITEFQFYAGYATPVFKANSSGFFTTAAGVSGTSTGQIGQFKFVKPLAATASRVLMNGADGIATNVTSATPSTTYLHPDGTEGSPSGSGIPTMDGTGTNLTARYPTGSTNTPFVVRDSNGVAQIWVETNNAGVISFRIGPTNGVKQTYDPATGELAISGSNGFPVLFVRGQASVLGSANIGIPLALYLGTLTTTNLATFLAGINVSGAAQVGGLISTNGETNLTLTASTIMRADANKKPSSVANGAGMLTNDGSGVVGYMAIPSGGSGGTNFPPVIANGGGQQASTNVTVGLGVRQILTITTNASFKLVFTGTSLNGEPPLVGVSNTSSSTIYMSNTAYNVGVASNDTVWPIAATSVRWFQFISHTNWNVGSQRWEVIWSSQKEMELGAGIGVVFATNAANSLITVHASAGLSNLNNNVGSTVTNENSTALVISAGTLALSPGPASNLVNNSQLDLGNSYTKAGTSVTVTNLLGVTHKAVASPLELDANSANNFTVTNRVTAATTLVITNTSDGQIISIFLIGEASGGTSRVITLVPHLGHLVADEDTFGTALATSTTFTLTNGNAAEISWAIRRMNGTNIAAKVTRQFAF